MAALGGSSVGPALTGRGEFVSAAAEYCQLYERASELDAERFLVGLERVLPRLLATGLELSFSDDDDELPEDEADLSLTIEERQAVDWPVQALLGKLDWSDAEDRLDRPAGGTMLSDDLSDIYADLKEGFRLLDAGRPEVEADFVWYQGYWSHWATTARPRSGSFTTTWRCTSARCRKLGALPRERTSGAPQGPRIASIHVAGAAPRRGRAGNS